MKARCWGIRLHCSAAPACSSMCCSSMCCTAPQGLQTHVPCCHGCHKRMLFCAAAGTREPCLWRLASPLSPPSVTSCCVCVWPGTESRHVSHHASSDIGMVLLAPSKRALCARGIVTSLSCIRCPQHRECLWAQQLRQVKVGRHFTPQATAAEGAGAVVVALQLALC
jgi:hypothetical protein